MQLKTLGRTGVKVPEIGLGTWEFTGKPETLRRGVEIGASFIDTAEIYGTEDVVGKAISGIRQKVFLATKASPNHFKYDDLLMAAENSLRRLGTSTIDLYQLHWPSNDVPIRETMRAMEKLVKEGKIAHIGISNFSVQQTKEAQEALSRYEVVSNQVEYHLLDRSIESELIPFCERESITIVAYSPLARGSLAHPSIQNKRLSSVLESVRRTEGKTTAQVSLNWINSRENVVAIPKANSPEHVREDCEASGWHLSQKSFELIDEASKG